MMFCRTECDNCIPADMPAGKVASATENCVFDSHQDPLLGCQVAANRDRISRISLDTPATVRSDKRLKKAADRNTGRI